MTTWENMVSNALGSAAAGILSRISTHPLDTVKARLQADHQKQRYKGPFDGLKRTYTSEGVKGLYRGFSTVIVGGTPGTILYLCSYDIFKERIFSFQGYGSHDGTARSEDSFGVHFASGLLAEAVACTVYVPVDVIKERLQVQGRHANEIRYTGGADALVKIWYSEGLHGMYRGYGATLMSFGPFSALYFVFYERFKSWSKELTGSATLALPWLVLSSASAGGLASFLTSPLDMAKLRLQVDRGRNQASTVSTVTRYRGIIDCLQQAYAYGGIRNGLFRGAGARVLHFVPATTVTMTCYESMRQFFLTRLFEI